ncbi:aminotransferase-like domain-containing protein [Pseudomonas sp. HK3]
MPHAKMINLPLSNPAVIPARVSTHQVVVDIMEKGAAFDLLPSSAKDQDNPNLRRSFSRAYRKAFSYEQNYYDTPLGSPTLRAQIVNRLHAGGSHLIADDIVITSGCQHALQLALMATTQPGAVVAIESPGFYGAIQLIEALGLQILELPSSPISGISIDAMTSAFEQWEVSALIISPNYSTPTGAALSEDDKQSVLRICQHHDVVIIEDDIYSELFFGLQRPRTIHSYDDSNTVLLCSSFSKCLSRDIRVGWIAAGDFVEQIKRLKIVTTLSVSTSVQQGLSDYIQRGHFDQYLRNKRTRLASQCLQLQHLLPDYLPSAIRWSKPKGGLSLWVELDANIDTALLYGRAQHKGITITPGILFSAQPNYRHCLRLSFAHEWTAQRMAALRSLGRLIEDNQ